MLYNFLLVIVEIYHYYDKKWVESTSLRDMECVFNSILGTSQLAFRS